MQKAWLQSNIQGTVMQIRQHGFSLIELMIVIVIIGILAIITIPSYRDYIARAQMTEAFTLTSGLKIIVSESFAEEGGCLDNNSENNTAVPPPIEIKGQYIVSVTTQDSGEACSIIARFKIEQVADAIKDKTVTLSMDKVSQVWSCHSDVDAKYLPRSCTSKETTTQTVT